MISAGVLSGHIAAEGSEAPTLLLLCGRLACSIARVSRRLLLGEKRHHDLGFVLGRQCSLFVSTQPSLRLSLGSEGCLLGKPLLLRPFDGFTFGQAGIARLLDRKAFGLALGKDRVVCLGKEFFQHGLLRREGTFLTLLKVRVSISSHSNSRFFRGAYMLSNTVLATSGAAQTARKCRISMHSVSIRPEIHSRVLARRGRAHWFDRLDSARTALLVIDMQTAFCEPGAPAEVPLAREIVPPINALTRALRNLGCPVIWVVHANTSKNGRSDWEMFFNHVVGDDVRQRTMDALAPGNQTIWRKLDVADGDHTVIKNRYSALIAGSSQLERLLRSLNMDTVLIAGTKTNVCCESTARDAMMLDFKVVLLSDCCAALSDDEHRSAMENIFQQFGDVSTADEALRKLQTPSNA